MPLYLRFARSRDRSSDAGSGEGSSGAGSGGGFVRDVGEVLYRKSGQNWELYNLEGRLDRWKGRDILKMRWLNTEDGRLAIELVILAQPGDIVDDDGGGVAGTPAKRAAGASGSGGASPKRQRVEQSEGGAAAAAMPPPPQPRQQQQPLSPSKERGQQQQQQQPGQALARTASLAPCLPWTIQPFSSLLKLPDAAFGPLAPLARERGGKELAVVVSASLDHAPVASGVHATLAPSCKSLNPAAPPCLT